VFDNYFNIVCIILHVCSCSIKIVFQVIYVDSVFFVTHFLCDLCNLFVSNCIQLSNRPDILLTCITSTHLFPLLILSTAVDRGMYFCVVCIMQEI
jgi:hypothetical protein